MVISWNLMRTKSQFPFHNSFHKTVWYYQRKPSNYLGKIYTFSVKNYKIFQGSIRSQIRSRSRFKNKKGDIQSQAGNKIGSYSSSLWFKASRNPSLAFRIRLLHIPLFTAQATRPCTTRVYYTIQQSPYKALKMILNIIKRNWKNINLKAVLFRIENHFWNISSEWSIKVSF